MSTETFIYKGKLAAHTSDVTCLATTVANNNLLISGARDKTLIVWELTREQNNYGFAKKRLRGHEHFVSDVKISSDAQFALSGSWDKTLRLWELETGETSRVFKDHQKDVLTVAFSSDNRQIVSGGRDRSLKLWNTLGECKYTITDGAHNDWATTACFSPNAQKPVVVSGSYDKVVKVWDMASCKLLTNLIGHTGYINTVTVSPDGSLCASGGKDQSAMLWDLNKGQHLYSLEAGDVVNALAFSPNRYWLVAATPSSIKIWDLQSKVAVAELQPENLPGSKVRPSCTSLAWSADGSVLFTGMSNGDILVWGVTQVQQ